VQEFRSSGVAEAGELRSGGVEVDRGKKKIGIQEFILE
jgi:hypothetical protein